MRGLVAWRPAASGHSDLLETGWRVMKGIFISYRRDDAAGYAGRLYDRLAAHFGRDRVFMDVEGIEPGVDFVDAIEGAVGSCEVLIVIIGKDWLAADAVGKRRLDDPGDFVRIETAAALARNIRVVPVLVDDAEMPRAKQLPRKPGVARTAAGPRIEPQAVGRDQQRTDSHAREVPECRQATQWRNQPRADEPSSESLPEPRSVARRPRRSRVAGQAPLLGHRRRAGGTGRGRCAVPDPAVEQVRKPAWRQGLSVVVPERRVSRTASACHRAGSNSHAHQRRRCPLR